MIDLEEIFRFAETGVGHRSFIEGERLVKASDILFCGRESNKTGDTSCNLLGYCVQTTDLRGKPHEITGVLENEKIKSMKCTCKAGLSSKCKHIVAFLLCCYRINNLNDLPVVSCTDKKCLWNEPHQKSLKKYEAMPLHQHACYAEDSQRTAIVLTTEQETRFRQRLMNTEARSALLKHMCGRHEPLRDTNNNPFESCISTEDARVIVSNGRSEVMQMLADIPYEPLRECCQKLLKKLEGDVILISQETQVSLISWQNERHLRITGSRCYGLFTYTKNKNPNWQEKALKHFYPTPFTSVHTKHGLKYEPIARDVYANVTSAAVKQCGLIVSENNPWLAYSPDGVIITDNKPSKLLEIKCPYGGLKMSVEELCSTLKYLVLRQNQMTLKKKHAYYAQVQLGMAVLNVMETDFVIYASSDKSIKILSIPFDEEYFTEMFHTLKLTYFNNMLHYVCEKNQQQ